jgi:hypothetical protein
MSSPRAAVLALLGSAFTFAQTSSSLIQGTITDSTGAPVPNVRVVATLANTDTNYSTATNESGNYVMPNVRPGEYSISAEAPAFKRTVRTGVVIEVNQHARIDLTLQVGEVKESVEVSANTNNVDTYTASINETVDSHRVADLPLNGRQALQLQALLPGVVLAPEGQAASFIALNTNLTFSINGTRPSASLYMLDGAINMDMYNNTPAAFPNPDALQEFTIQTTNYTSIVGGTPGAAVNMVTKSGSNAYHGELYEFLRNTELNARNFFAAGVPALHKNQFGANAGGPIRRNKTFFFGAYEGNRQRQPVTSAGNVVPTALERQGDFSQSKLSTGPVRDPLNNQPFPNNVIPTTRLDPVALKFAADFLPLPNFGTNQLNYTLSIPYTDDRAPAAWTTTSATATTSCSDICTTITATLTTMPCSPSIRATTGPRTTRRSPTSSPSTRRPPTPLRSLSTATPSSARLSQPTPHPGLRWAACPASSRIQPASPPTGT